VFVFLWPNPHHQGLGNRSKSQRSAGIVSSQESYFPHS
jgi:hypothetical protein